MKTGSSELDSSQDRASSGVNDTGTCEKTDTPPTQRRSRRVLKLAAKRLRKITHGRIYFVRAGDAIKIGFSINSTNRLAGLQTSNADQIDLLATIQGTERDEQRLHHQFRDLHLRGEWFRPDARLLEFIEGLTEEGRAAAAARAKEEAAMAKEARKRPRSKLTPEMLALMELRVKHGAHSLIGGRCSNLIEQLKNYQHADGDAKANLEKFMAKSVADIAKLQRS